MEDIGVDGSEIRKTHQLRLVAEIPIFTRFQHHPRWLFGVSEPSTV